MLPGKESAPWSWSARLFCMGGGPQNSCEDDFYTFVSSIPCVYTLSPIGLILDPEALVFLDDY
jgi:hypothetical protein